MEWELLDENGDFLRPVNCQYDALDLSSLLYNAVEVEIDFINKKAKIKSRG